MLTHFIFDVFKVFLISFTYIFLKPNLIKYRIKILPILPAPIIPTLASKKLSPKCLYQIPLRIFKFEVCIDLNEVKIFADKLGKKKKKMFCELSWFNYYNKYD